MSCSNSVFVAWQEGDKEVVVGREEGEEECQDSKRRCITIKDIL